MVRPAPSELDGETIPVPRTVRFPVELIPPDGLGEDVRAADAAVWPRADVDAGHAGLLSVAPLLAAEVASREEPATHLHDKARWYLEAGVAAVWCLFPEEREVLVSTSAATARHHAGDRVPPHPRLPGLTPLVDELFGTSA